MQGTAMDRERWQAAERIFERALEEDAATRDAFLAEACDGDSALRSEVEGLLRHHESAEADGVERFERMSHSSCRIDRGSEVGPRRPVGRPGNLQLSSAVVKPCCRRQPRRYGRSGCRRACTCASRHRSRRHRRSADSADRCLPSRDTPDRGR